MKLDKNKKIALGIGIFALLFIAYKKGVFGGVKTSNTPETPETPSTPSLPIVEVSSGSETPQVSVVNIPPQFGSETAVFNRLPEGAFQTFN
jgi:hypothetical protein